MQIEIGKGLYLGYPYNIIVREEVVLEDNANLYEVYSRLCCCYWKFCSGILKKNTTDEYLCVKV